MATSETTSFRAAFGRITWMFFGPMALFVTAVGLFTTKGGLFTILDVPYFTALGAMLLGRWLEYRSGHGQTATGEPATLPVVRRYMILVGFLGLTIWGLAAMLRLFPVMH